MTRRTSIDTYNEIREEGLLGELQFKVYEALYANGPLTQGELWQKCFPTAQRHDIGPRVAELVSLGVAAHVDERPCSVTGRTCMVWDVTDRLPEKRERRKSRAQAVAEIVANLQISNATLRAENAALHRELDAERAKNTLNHRELF